MPFCDFNAKIRILKFIKELNIYMTGLLCIFETILEVNVNELHLIMI